MKILLLLEEEPMVFTLPALLIYMEIKEIIYVVLVTRAVHQEKVGAGILQN